MAYTKTPTMDTYSEEDIDLSREINARGATVAKDEDYVNVFIEKIKSKVASDDRTFLVKRAGTGVFIDSYTNGTIRGSIFWVDQQKLYYSVGKDIRVFNLSTSTGTTISNVFTTTSGDVGFAEYIYDDGTIVLIASDGTDLVQISTSNVVTKCVDPDLPSPHEPHIIFLDGYIFLIKTNTGDIYNSDANNPLSYDSSEFINAEIEADYLKRLVKVNNYLVALGTETIEYLWDAAVATGSPLQRNDTPVKRIAYLGGLAQERNNSFFVGKDHNGTVQVYKLYDFKTDPISSSSVNRYLGSINGEDPMTWYGNCVSFQGHHFYILNAGTKTWCYDIEEDLWTRVSYQSNTNFDMFSSHNVINAAFPASSIFTLNDGTTTWYSFSDSLYQDNEINYPCTSVTDSYDFGTLNRKTMHRLSIFGDRPPVNANILIQWTDDDYQSYNTGLSTNMNQDLPCIRQLGSFRQRAFKLTFTANTSFRIQKLRAIINKGNS